MTSSRKAVATAPSTTRWSNVHETRPMSRTRMAPSTTAGRGAIRWTPRIATSGWLTSGVAKSPPSRPALDTVNVDPRSCSGVERPGRGRRAELGDLRGQLLDRL